MISEFFFSKIWWKLNCFSIASCLRVFSSRRIWIFLANPDRTLQKIKKFQVVLCSLKLFLIFQLDIQDICQIQHNLKQLWNCQIRFKNNQVAPIKWNIWSFTQIRWSNLVRCLEFREEQFSRKVSKFAKFTKVSPRQSFST